MRIAVVANGDWDKKWGNQELANYDFLIAADGGGNHIIDSGYMPDALVGDLDSIKASYLEACRTKRTAISSYPREKDETDLELALEYAAKLLWEKEIENEKPKPQGKEPRRIFLLGAIGGRIDHFLGNLFIMTRFLDRGIQIRMKAPDQELWLLEGLIQLQGKKGQQISLIPMTQEAVVETEGLQYPLCQEVLHQGSPRGISNVFLGEDASIEVSSGRVLVIKLVSPEE